MSEQETQAASQDPSVPKESPIGSLRTFHVFFVWACGILAFLFGVWALSQFVTAGGGVNMVMAICAFCLVVLLAFYGRWFLHKLRRMHIA